MQGSKLNKADQKQIGAIHLQSIGLVPAREASLLKSGDRLMYNFGYTYTVLTVKEASKFFVEIEEANDETGEIFKRKLKKDRLVAVVN
jgi:hypothetical protein